MIVDWKYFEHLIECIDPEKFSDLEYQQANDLIQKEKNKALKLYQNPDHE